jgi:hypothetical protein
MAELAAAASNAEIKATAEYFSLLKSEVRVKVIETDTVPHTHAAGWILVVDMILLRNRLESGLLKYPKTSDNSNTETLAPASLPMCRLVPSLPERPSSTPVP